VALACLATLAILAASTVAGAAVWRIAGLPAAPHLGPAVGFAALLVVAEPVVALPGHARTALAVLLALVVGALLDRRVREAVRAGLGDGVPVALGALALLMLPFLVSGHFGILAMGNNDDWVMHLSAVRWLASREIPVTETVVAVGYPVGPQALAAAVTAAGVSVVPAMTAVTAIGPILAARAALAALPPLRRPLRWGLALLAGVPYLVASYYAQVAHKEVLVAALAFAFVLALPAVARGAARGHAAGAARAALPGAVLIAGAVQVMSWPGALWPLATLAAWALLWRTRGARRRRRGSELRDPRAVAPGPREAPARARRRAVRRLVPGLLAGGATVVLLLAPDLSRIAAFQGSSFAHEPAHGLGNLEGSIPPWEALGVWLAPDFRFGTHAGLIAWPLLAGAAALVITAVVRWLREGPRVLAAALAGGWGVWVVLTIVKNPYNAAKGLAILTPLMGLALVTGALIAWSALGGRARVLRRAAVVAVLLGAGASSFLALRDGVVGVDAHASELRALAAVAQRGGGRTAFLDDSDFGTWDLFALRPARPLLLYPIHLVALRPEKAWRPGRPLDLDALSSDTLNRFRWVIAPNTRFASAAPPGLWLAHRTPSWLLWERVARVAPRGTLAEGVQPGAALDCSTPAGRALSRRPGTATVRARPVVAGSAGWSGDARAAGSQATRTLALPPGRWDLSLQYVSRNPVIVLAPGLRVRLPANLDRMGSLFSAGTLTSRGRPVAIRVRIDPLGRFGRLLGAAGRTRALNSPGHRALGMLAATRHGDRPHTVPLAGACGRYVDSYALR
jgi:hypothetical protein